MSRSSLRSTGRPTCCRVAMGSAVPASAEAARSRLLASVHRGDRGDTRDRADRTPGGARQTFVVSNGADTVMFAPDATKRGPCRHDMPASLDARDVAGCRSHVGRAQPPDWPADVPLVVVGDGVEAERVSALAPPGSGPPPGAPGPPSPPYPGGTCPVAHALVALLCNRIHHGLSPGTCH